MLLQNTWVMRPEQRNKAHTKVCPTKFRVEVTLETLIQLFTTLINKNDLDQA